MVTNISILIKSLGLIILLISFGCKATSQVNVTKLISDCSNCEKIPVDIRDWIEIDSIRFLALEKFVENYSINHDTLYIGNYYDTNSNMGSGWGFGFIFNSRKELNYEYNNYNIKYLKGNLFNNLITLKIKNWDINALIEQGKNSNQLLSKTKSSYPVYVIRIEILRGEKIKMDCFNFLSHL